MTFFMPHGDPRLTVDDKHVNLVGERVRERRIYLEMTRNELNARIAEVSNGGWNPDPQVVQAIEIGRRRVYDTEVVVLAKALTVSPLWLLTGQEQWSVG